MDNKTLTFDLDSEDFKDFLDQEPIVDSIEPEQLRDLTDEEVK